MRIPLRPLLVFFYFCFGLGLTNQAWAQKIPGDFEVTFTSQPAMVRDDLEVESLTIDSNGKVHLSAKYFYSGDFPNITRGELGEETLTLSQDAMAAILSEVTENDFFTLQETYEDPRIADGDFATLKITMNGQTYSVTTRNIKVLAFDRITLAINNHLPKERRLLYNAINGADYLEVER